MDISESVAVATGTRGARRREETRRRLLTAARVVFAREGLEAATIAEITAEADAGFGTFYLHFATKEEAYRAVITEGFDELAANLDGVMDATRGAPWPVTVREAVRAYVEFAARNRELFTVMCAGGDFERGVCHELAERFAIKIAAQLTRGGAEITDPAARPWPYPPMPVALATISALTRAITWWLSHEGLAAASERPQDCPSDESREVLIATMSRYVTAALWGQIPGEGAAGE